MKLFSYLSEWKQSVDLARIFRAGMTPWELFKQMGKTRKTDDESLMKRYKDWVYVCATKNAEAVAQVPLRLYVVTRNGERKPKEWVQRKALNKKQSEYIWKNASTEKYVRKAVEIEEVIDHPFLDLWYEPNPHTAGFSFRQLITTDQELVGDSYVYVYKDEVLGIPKELWRLPPQWTCVVPGQKEFIKGYLYGRTRDKRISFDPDEIVHFLYPNPRDQYYGMSPVEGSMSAVDIDDAMSKYDLTVMDNQGRPDFIVSYKGKLNPAKIEKLQKEWGRLHKGKPNVGRPTFLDQEADIKTLGWSPREMAFLSGRKWSMKQICNAHGVPISKVDVESVNLANAHAGNYQYMKDTIWPRCIRQQETINQNIVQKYDE
ncbi:MAG: phage portal protein, partial [Candidatus Peribacteraceae bacterium]|nr:phage portal protein [Candidatus Peribacteraceae bacterium]